MTGIGPGSFPPDDDDGPGRDDEDGLGRAESTFGLDADGDDLDDLESADDYDDEIAATFHPIPGGASCRFAPAQAGVIRSLVGQVAELVRSETETGIEPAEAPGARPDVSSSAPDELERMLGLSGNAELPEDPVLARLLPDAYSDDPEASAEFRRYTEETLRAGKISSARAVLASLPAGGGDVVLSEPECQQWLKALNDVRLALGVRLGITDESQELSDSVSADDPRSAYVWVYQWLAYLQESLIEALA
jgi:hypothetical protein